MLQLQSLALSPGLTRASVQTAGTFANVSNDLCTTTSGPAETACRKNILPHFLGLKSDPNHILARAPWFTVAFSKPRLFEQRVRHQRLRDMAGASGRQDFWILVAARSERRDKNPDRRSSRRPVIEVGGRAVCFNVCCLKGFPIRALAPEPREDVGAFAAAFQGAVGAKILLSPCGFRSPLCLANRCPSNSSSSASVIAPVTSGKFAEDCNNQGATSPASEVVRAAHSGGGGGAAKSFAEMRFDASIFWAVRIGDLRLGLAEAFRHQKRLIDSIRSEVGDHSVGAAFG